MPRAERVAYEEPGLQIECLARLLILQHLILARRENYEIATICRRNLTHKE